MSAATFEEIRAAHPLVFARAKRTFTIQIAAIVLCLVYGVFCLWLFDITWLRLTQGLSRITIVLGQMVVWKHFWTWDFAGIFEGLAQSLAMAFLGTIMASLIALPFAFLAARTVVRPALPRHAVRRMFDVLRGIDQLIWALVYVRAFGLGPLSGLLAIFTSDIGTLGKLYSEALENVDRKQVDGVLATGASKMQVYRYGFMPQIFPVFVSQLLYFIESNTRSATVLGVVGAGGIGLQLSERMKVQYWDQAAFIILLIFITVSLVDQASFLIRRRFIGVSGL